MKTPISSGFFGGANLRDFFQFLHQDPGEAPESAFEFQPTKIKTMVGGLVSWKWFFSNLPNSKILKGCGVSETFSDGVVAWSVALAWMACFMAWPCSWFSQSLFLGITTKVRQIRQKPGIFGYKSKNLKSMPSGVPRHFFFRFSEIHIAFACALEKLFFFSCHPFCLIFLALKIIDNSRCRTAIGNSRVENILRAFGPWTRRPGGPSPGTSRKTYLDIWQCFDDWLIWKEFHAWT